MEQSNLPYFFDIDSQPYTDTGLRYFILDSDRPQIDHVLKENEIIASTETIPSYDYRDQKKIGKLTLIIAGIIVLLMILLILI